MKAEISVIPISAGGVRNIPPGRLGLYSNPFVPIAPAARFLIIAYFIGWRIVPTIATLAAPEISRNIFGTLLVVGTQLLLLAPFLVRRFAATPIGWLHPLILPTMIAIVFGLLRNPAMAIAPIVAWSHPAPVPSLLHIGLSNFDVLNAQLWLDLLNLLALACAYIGFGIGARVRGTMGVNSPVSIGGARIALAFLLSLLVVFVFLQQQGGILQHMTSLAGGRFRMRELNGQFLVLNAFLPYLLLIWYAYRPGAVRNPLFLAAFALASAMQFVVTGSRSALFTPGAVLLAVWMFHNRRLPAMNAILLGAAAVLSIGILGEIRSSGRDGAFDLDAADTSFTSAWTTTQTEFQARNVDTDLAIVALVPWARDYLHGITYAAAATFWIPRSIWREKPRGAGAHASALLFNRLETMEGYQGGGYPVGGTAEAYWNFGIVGVIVVSLLFGMFLRLMAVLLARNSSNPFVIVAFLATMFEFTSPATTNLVPLLQIFVLLSVTYLLTRKPRPER